MKRKMVKLGVTKNTATQSADALDKLISYNKYEKPAQASKFFLRKRTEILSLLPGAKHPGYKTLLKEFQENLERSVNTLNGTI